MSFIVLPHTADLKIRVFAESLPLFFAESCVGMFQAIDPEPRHPENCFVQNELLVCKEFPKKHRLKISSTDQNALLVDFLSEALYLSDVHDEAYLKAEVHELSQTSIHATIYGIPINRFAVEIKAVTFHDLNIEEIDGLWQADIVFDI